MDLAKCISRYSIAAFVDFVNSLFSVRLGFFCRIITKRFDFDRKKASFYAKEP
jgi:hypothetical protein